MRFPCPQGGGEQTARVAPARPSASAQRFLHERPVGVRPRIAPAARIRHGERALVAGFDILRARDGLGDAVHQRREMRLAADHVGGEPLEIGLVLVQEGVGHHDGSAAGEIERHHARMRGCHQREAYVEIGDDPLVLLEAGARHLQELRVVGQADDAAAQPDAAEVPAFRIEDAGADALDQRHCAQLEHVPVHDRPGIERECPLVLVDGAREEGAAFGPHAGACIVEVDVLHAARDDVSDIAVEEELLQRRGREQRVVVHVVGALRQRELRVGGIEIRLVVLDQVEERPAADPFHDLLGEIGAVPDGGDAIVAGADVQRLLSLADIFVFQRVERVLQAGIVLERFGECLRVEAEIVEHHEPHVMSAALQEARRLEHPEEARRHGAEFERGHEHVDRLATGGIDEHVRHVVDPVEQQMHRIAVEHLQLRDLVRGVRCDVA